MIEIDRDHFEQLVAYAMETIPAQLSKEIQNVAILIEDNPPDDQPNLLGLYRGIPLTQKQPSSWGGALPDTITIYRNSILRICSSYEDVVRQVRVTVVHEVGHYFGLTESRLHELGYG